VPYKRLRPPTKEEGGVSEEHREIRVVIVVSGQPEHLEVHPDAHLEKVVREALDRSGNHGQAPSEWELRREDGALLNQSERVDEAGITNGTTLFLNPKAGAGGGV
jgi:hypothetical protein